jgi:hypothetical protein
MEDHREAARALRAIGRDCIQKRIKALEEGQTVPHDILTCILKTASEYQPHFYDLPYMYIPYSNYWVYACPNAARRGVVQSQYRCIAI